MALVIGIFTSAYPLQVKLIAIHVETSPSSNIGLGRTSHGASQNVVSLTVAVPQLIRRAFLV